MFTLKKIAKLGKEDRVVLFTRTGEKMNMHPAIIEKDFWVCFMLDHLFHDSLYKDVSFFAIIFGWRRALRSATTDLCKEKCLNVGVNPIKNSWCCLHWAF